MSGHYKSDLQRQPQQQHQPRLHHFQQKCSQGWKITPIQSGKEDWRDWTLAKKFKLRITVHNKSGRKKIELNEEEETWIENFLERSGITYTFPGRADTVYVGMDDSKREYKLKRYIFWKLHNSCYLFLKEMQIWSPF